MKFNEFINAAREYNKTYGNTFFISTNELIVSNANDMIKCEFSEELWNKESFKGMREVLENRLVPLSKATGRALMYRGLKWSDLTDEQKLSVIVDEKKLGCEGAYFIEPEEYESYFNNNHDFYKF